MQEIKTIKIKNLLEYIHSQEYINSENLPISVPRAISYLNNKRADSEDVAMVLLFSEGKLTAYRCLFPDYIYTNTHKIKFSWISGSWVDPRYRRTGYSMKLLLYIIKELHIHLLYSNYAPQSKALYDKSKEFVKVYELSGMRFYFRFAFFELLPPRHPFFMQIKSILSGLDFFLNTIFDLRFMFIKTKTPDKQCIETSINEPELKKFIETFNKINPFQRGVDEFAHAFEYPWILEKNKPDTNDKKYIFSSSAKLFKYKIYKILNNDSEITGFFMIKIRDKTISVPYAFIEAGDAKYVVNRLIYFVKLYKLKYLSVFNESIIRAFNKNKLAVLFFKPMIKDFYAANNIAESIEKNAVFFEGDGDNLYT